LLRGSRSDGANGGGCQTTGEGEREGLDNDDDLKKSCGDSWRERWKGDFLAVVVPFSRLGALIFYFFV
jgi:hypothetical protein